MLNPNPQQMSPQQFPQQQQMMGGGGGGPPQQPNMPQMSTMSTMQQQGYPNPVSSGKERQFWKALKSNFSNSGL